MFSTTAPCISLLSQKSLLFLSKAVDLSECTSLLTTVSIHLLPIFSYFIVGIGLCAIRKEVSFNPAAITCFLRNIASALGCKKGDVKHVKIITLIHTPHTKLLRPILRALLNLGLNIITQRNNIELLINFLSCLNYFQIH